MTRGDIFSVVLPKAFGKPRPAVIVQSDGLTGIIATTVVCPMTTDLGVALSFRPLIEPATGNGLTRPSQIMVDKLQAMPVDKVGHYMGRLAPEDEALLNRALLIVLALP